MGKLGVRVEDGSWAKVRHFAIGSLIKPPCLRNRVISCPDCLLAGLALAMILA